ncbi:TetR/AcrR family transcriptional regulator [Spirochaetota bacterium]
MDHLMNRDVIFKKFQELSVEHGVKRVTVDRLAKELGISKKTVYKYYNSKDEIINVLVGEIIIAINTIKDEFTKMGDRNDNPKEILYKFFDILFEFVRNLPLGIIQEIEEYYSDVKSEMDLLRNEYSGIFKKIIMDGITQGVFKNINPQFAERFYLGAVNNIFVPEFLLQKGVSVDDILTFFKSMLLTGLLKEEGVKRENHSNYNELATIGT